MSLCLVVACGLVTGCRPRNAGVPRPVATGSTTNPRPTAPAPHQRPAATSGARFVEIATRSGVSFQFHNDARPGRFFLPEVMGGGVAWLDFDLDGLIDLFCINGGRLGTTPPDTTRHRDRLFRNIGSGQFLHASQALPEIDRGFGHGIAAGDANADGFPDLFLACYGADRLLLNNGDGTFSVSPARFVESSDRWSTSVAWFDGDGDGDLDLFVAGYLALDLSNHQACQYDGRPGYCGPGRFAAVPDSVYLNNGDGTFTESAVSLGFRHRSRDTGTLAAVGKSLAVVAVDLDNDTQPEIYVGNDLTPNSLYTRSRTEGSLARGYRDVAATSGVAYSGDGENEASMGIACGDFDRDGRFDLFLTHYFQNKNTLYRNLGQRPGSKFGSLSFFDQSRRSRIAASSYAFLGFGTIAFDVERDSDLDLFVANGHVLGPDHPPSGMTAQLLANDGSGRFSDVSASSGNYFSRELLGRGVAAADLDNDGDIDLAISHLDAPLALLRNDTKPTGGWIGLVILGPRIGGRVELLQAPDSVSDVVPLVSAGSYLSESDPRVVLTLPGGAKSASIRVHRPGMGSRDHSDLAAGRYWLLPRSGPALEVTR